MKYVLGFDIGGTKSAVLLVSPDKEHVVFLERKSIPTHGTWKEVLGCLADMGESLSGNAPDIQGKMLSRHFLRRAVRQRQRRDSVAA
ncbi:MAG: hypothetical protein ACLR0U_00095 [Enterocloster clostridioformis]